MQVLELAQCLNLDSLAQSVQEHVVSLPWSGANLDALIVVINSMSKAEIRALLHHSKAHAFAELQVRVLGRKLCLMRSCYPASFMQAAAMSSHVREHVHACLHKKCRARARISSGF